MKINSTVQDYETDVLTKIDSIIASYGEMCETEKEFLNSIIKKN